MVVNSNGKFLFCHFLTDYILIQEGFNIGWFQVSGRGGVPIKNVLFLNQKVAASFDTFVANADGW
jgi:hypothetical protein